MWVYKTSDWWLIWGTKLSGCSLDCMRWVWLWEYLKSVKDLNLLYYFASWTDSKGAEAMLVCRWISLKKDYLGVWWNNDGLKHCLENWRLSKVDFVTAYEQSVKWQSLLMLSPGGMTWGCDWTPNDPFGGDERTQPCSSHHQPQHRSVSDGNKSHDTLLRMFQLVI